MPKFVIPAWRGLFLKIINTYNLNASSGYENNFEETFTALFLGELILIQLFTVRFKFTSNANYINRRKRFTFFNCLLPNSECRVLNAVHESVFTIWKFLPLKVIKDITLVFFWDGKFAL